MPLHIKQFITLPLRFSKGFYVYYRDAWILISLLIQANNSTY